jgi:hypothetical protein
MDTHYMNGWVVANVFHQECFDVNQPTRDGKAKVIMEPPLTPIRLRFPNLVDLATGFDVSEKLFANSPCCEAFQVVFDPFSRHGLPRNVPGAIPFAERVSELL